MTAKMNKTDMLLAVAHDLGTGIGDALRAKKDATEAASKGKAAKAAVNAAIKRGAIAAIKWPEGNKRSNPMADGISNAIGTVEGITARTKDNYLAAVKWCFKEGVVLQTWDLDAQKRKDQICAVTGKPKAVAGCGAQAPHCAKGFHAMQESQEGFEEWVAVLATMADYTKDEMTILLWEAMEKVGHAERSDTGEWVVK